MTIREQVEKIESRKDLAEFIEALRNDLVQGPEDWENPTLESHLEALAAITADLDGYFRNCGEQAPSRKSWRFIGELRGAAPSDGLGRLSVCPPADAAFSPHLPGSGAQ